MLSRNKGREGEGQLVGGAGLGGLASCLENSLGNPNVNEHILEMCKY